MYLLDTNVLIYYLKGIEDVFPFVESLKPVAVSIISKIELLGRKGLTNPEIKKLENFLEAFFKIS